MRSILAVLLLVSVGCAACAAPAPSVLPSATERPDPSGSGFLLSPPASDGPVVVTPVPQGTPGADADRASALLDRYERALVAGDWQAAWDLLAPQARVALGSFADFASERKAYFVSAGDRYSLTAPEHDGKVLAQWLPAGVDTGADLDRAYVIEVDYAALAAFNAYEVFLVAPTTAGTWGIWSLR